MDENLIRRINALKQMSERGTEHEATLAAQHLQNLLMEHNLSLAEVEGKSTKSETLGGKRVKTAHDAAAMYSYQRKLMETLAGNNFCYYSLIEKFRPDPKGRKSAWYFGIGVMGTPEGDVRGRMVKAHRLIGREDNVVGTQVIYDYLIETMDRLLPYQGMEKRGKNALLWLEGCTDRLTERLMDLRHQQERETRRKQKEQAARGETGLVRLSDVYNSEEDFNTDFVYGYAPGTTARERAERNARYAAERDKQEELMAGGMSANEAWYVSRGLPVPAGIALATTATEEKETPAQREKREKKEARESDRWHQQRTRESNKRWAKTSTEAYRSGSSTADNISLNRQVDSSKQSQLR